MPVRTHTSPEGPQNMNIDYENIDPFTKRPAVYDDPFLQAEPLTLAAYSPSHPQKAATAPNHD